MTAEPPPRASRAQTAPAPPDDLDAVLADVWRRLSRGVADRRSPLHTLAVATNGLTGPQVRTVVLRGVDRATRTITFHTDVRSRKFAELEADPHIAVLAYDGGPKMQLRLRGRAICHCGDAIAAAVWAGARATGKAGYHQAEPPGTPIVEPGSLGAPLADGFVNFVVVCVVVETLDWLMLGHDAHRRAYFAWPDGQMTAQWIAP